VFRVVESGRVRGKATFARRVTAYYIILPQRDAGCGHGQGEVQGNGLSGSTHVAQIQRRLLQLLTATEIAEKQNAKTRRREGTKNTIKK